jgi:AcrR family transcriptional regulator
VTELAIRSHDRILLQALALFSDRGYDATSVREICEAAGVTKPTLYHFYGSKEGVYRALVEGTLDQYRDGVRAIVEATGTVPERLKTIARGHFTYTQERPELVRFLISLIDNPPGSAPATDFHRLYDEVLSHYARLIQEGVDNGTLAPGPVAVRLLVFSGAMMEAIRGFLFAARPELTAELADTLVDTILRGWSAPITA